MAPSRIALAPHVQRRRLPQQQRRRRRLRPERRPPWRRLRRRRRHRRQPASIHQKRLTARNNVGKNVTSLITGNRSPGAWWFLKTLYCEKMNIPASSIWLAFLTFYRYGSSKKPATASTNCTLGCCCKPGWVLDDHDECVQVIKVGNCHSLLLFSSYIGQRVSNDF